MMSGEPFLRPGHPNFADVPSGPHMTAHFAADAETVDRVLNYWVDQHWPLSKESALAIVKRASWGLAPEGPNFFRTHFFPDNEPGYFVTDLSGEVFTVTVSFGHLQPDLTNPATESTFRASFERASALLDARYGAQPSETADGLTMTTWYPPNGTSVVLGMSANHLTGHIYSPAWTALDPDEDDDDEW